MSGSRFINLIRKQASRTIPRGIEFATVLVPPPGLIIRIDNMAFNLEGDDLIVCESVYGRLQNGDRVAIIALPGEQQYLVFDKVVIAP